MTALARLDQERASARDTLAQLKVAYIDRANSLGEDGAVDMLIDELLTTPEWGRVEFAFALVESVARDVRKEQETQQ